MSDDGTSMAAPHVAGAAALALAANPSATTSQLKWALLSSVDAAAAFVGKSVTGGRLNARAAVAAILGPLPAPEPMAARSAGRPRRDADAGVAPARRRSRQPADRATPVVPWRPAGRRSPVTPAPALRAPRRQRRRLAQGRQGQAARELLARGRPPCASPSRPRASRSRTWTRAAHQRRQPVHAHAQAADRQHAQARQLHAVGRAQWEREGFRRDPRPVTSLRQRHGRQWSAAAPANARGSSLPAMSMSSWRSAGVSLRAWRTSCAARRRSSGVRAPMCRRASSASWRIAMTLNRGRRLTDLNIEAEATQLGSASTKRRR